jgi:hypothetical protein
MTAAPRASASGFGQDRSVSTGPGPAEQTATRTTEPVEPEATPSESVRDEYEVLGEDVRKHRFAYYQEDEPIISDAEFDDSLPAAGGTIEAHASRARGQRFPNPGGGRRSVCGVSPPSNICSACTASKTSSPSRNWRRGSPRPKPTSPSLGNEHTGLAHRTQDRRPGCEPALP